MVCKDHRVVPHSAGMLTLFPDQTICDQAKRRKEKLKRRMAFFWGHGQMENSWSHVRATLATKDETFYMSIPM
jgi:hypothetical protein